MNLWFPSPVLHNIAIVMSDTPKKRGDKPPTPGSGRQRKLAAARAARKQTKEASTSAPGSNWETLKKVSTHGWGDCGFG